jgi:hypothetical protein
VQLERCAPYAHLVIKCLMANYFTRWRKGSYMMGAGRIFLKSLGDTSINKDLLNEPYFGLIHLAGQYL